MPALFCDFVVNDTKKNFFFVFFSGVAGVLAREAKITRLLRWKFNVRATR